MKFVFGMLVVVCMALILLEVTQLQMRVKLLQKQIDALCLKSGNEKISANYISDELKKHILQLKREGKIVDAVNTVRLRTHLDLTEARQFVDQL